MALQSFQDRQLGVITIKPHATARHFIFRATSTGIQITCPLGATRSQIIEALERQRHKLPKLIRQNDNQIRLVKDASIQMLNFSVRITESGYGNLFQARYVQQVLEFQCPNNTDYSRAAVQAFFQKNIANVLKLTAKQYLPERLAQLAEKIGKNYHSCSVSYGKQRLGRCDSHGDILLSYRLMMLPVHLCDYVMLHELTHLTEMNHSPRFYALLDHYCDGCHRQLKQELASFRFLF